MPRLSHSSQFYHPHNIRWGVQIMKILIMKFSPLPLQTQNYCCGTNHNTNTNLPYLLTPWSKVLLEKLTSLRSFT
jgi:hypothetical protein